MRRLPAVKGGGIYIRVKAHDFVKEGGAFIAVAPWRGRGVARCPWRGGVRGGSSAAGALREEGEVGANSACLATRPKRSGGLAWPAWPLGPKVEEDFCSDKN
jgi:hypothetical protein